MIKIMNDGNMPEGIYNIISERYPNMDEFIVCNNINGLVAFDTIALLHKHVLPISILKHLTLNIYNDLVADELSVFVKPRNSLSSHKHTHLSIDYNFINMMNSNRYYSVIVPDNHLVLSIIDTIEDIYGYEVYTRYIGLGRVLFELPYINAMLISYLKLYDINYKISAKESNELVFRKILNNYFK